jgi:S-DNA-T family DNA segregation ATPase FtsK/SpoIIIE
MNTILPIELLEDMPKRDDEAVLATLDEYDKKIRDLYKTIGLPIRNLESRHVGPSVCRLEYTADPQINLTKFAKTSENIALMLGVARVRLLTPVPNKPTLGIEIPVPVRQNIGLKEMLNSDEFKNSDAELPILLGKSITGKPIVKDLATAPHLLIAGATGSGKSVCVNSIIQSLMFSRTSNEVNFLMIDPKMVELCVYDESPHLVSKVVTDVNDAIDALDWVSEIMKARYERLKRVGARNVESFRKITGERIPYLVVVLDEYADMMAIAKKDVERYVTKLASMSRAVGIHLILATQRPSADVVTGVIKANLPTNISFRVTSGINSRIIMDQSGAEKLLGQGDMLFKDSSMMNPERIQGVFVGDREVHDVVEFLKENGASDIMDREYSTTGIKKLKRKKKGNQIENPTDEDYIYDGKNLRPCIQEMDRKKNYTTSLVQRFFHVSWKDATDILDHILRLEPSIEEHRQAKNKKFKTSASK